MTKELVLKSIGLGEGTVTYSESANAFLTDGYTSQAGNTYLNSFKFGDGILIKEDIGIGYLHKFLNGLRIYSLRSGELLVDKSYHCFYYSKPSIIEESCELLFNILKQAVEVEGKTIDHTLAKQEIKRIIENAMECNQLEIMNQQGTKYLNS